MRFGINAFPLRAEGGGARFVFAGLWSAMLRLDATHTYLVFAHAEAVPLIERILGSVGPAMSADAARVRVVQIQDPGQIYAYRDEFDFWFAPFNNLQPRLYDRPSVAILHDIQEQYFPEYFSKAELLGRYEAYPEICRTATTLIAISEFCKQSFMEKFGIEPEKIEVIHNAPQAELVSRSNDGAWSGDPLPAEYFYYPANCYPHKNHALLLDAISAMRSAGESPRFVFTGYELPGGFPLRKELAARGLEDLCQVFTDLPAAEVRYLYRHARAAVLPTKFEGFGMPAVEAGALGCPVVCSDLPALRELMGDHALYFNPSNSAELVEQLRKVTRDAAVRKQLIEGGQVAAARFSWDGSARRMLEIFDRTRERFVWGHHAARSVRRPRIGILLRLTTGVQLEATLQSVRAGNYADVAMRCCVPPGAAAPTRDLLKSYGVQCIDLPAPPPAGAGETYADVERFAQEEKLDLVTGLIDGSRLKPTALDSLAWGFLYDPAAAIYIGEAMEWRGSHYLGIARLRFIDGDLWRVDGYLYPEIFCVNPAVVAQWPDGLVGARAGAVEWRWELLCAARREGKLLQLRRTVADCDRQTITAALPGAKRAGMMQYQHARGSRGPRSRLMRAVEPVMRGAAKVLPNSVQTIGTKLWYRLVK